MNPTLNHATQSPHILHAIGMAWLTQSISTFKESKVVGMMVCGMNLIKLAYCNVFSSVYVEDFQMYVQSLSRMALEINQAKPKWQCSICCGTAYILIFFQMVMELY
jgi:hypothetical protein